MPPGAPLASAPSRAPAAERARDALPLAGVCTVRAMKSGEEYLQDAAEAECVELGLRKAEREAHGRLMRLRVSVHDGAVTRAAENLWTEAAAALCDHQTKNGSSYDTA